MTLIDELDRRTNATARSVRRFWSGWGSIAVLIVALALVRAFLFQIFVVPSASMENTFHIGDRVMAQKVGQLYRGDIVVFADDLHWMGTEPQVTTATEILGRIGMVPDPHKNYLTKRVIGLPGDRVQAGTDGIVRVNGTALDETGYTLSASRKPSDVAFDVTVPAGKLLVMGDHRDNSFDSRCHLHDPGTAFVAETSVVGHVNLVAWPLNRITWTGIPATFNNVPEAPNPAPAQPVIALAPQHC